MTEQNARPAAPGPTMEEQLRKAVEADRGSARTETGESRRTMMQPALGMPFRGGSPNVGGVADIYGAAKTIGGQRPMPSGTYIAERLRRVLDRLRDASASADSIAAVLAGPGAPTGAAQAGEQPPAASLFVIYERTLDEIDRIIDNIEHEQARTRTIIGE